MKIIQDLLEYNVSDWRKHNFHVNHQDVQYKIAYDVHLPNGQRVHILEKPLDDMFVWRNAIIVGINHVEGFE